MSPAEPIKELLRLGLMLSALNVAVAEARDQGHRVIATFDPIGLPPEALRQAFAAVLDVMITRLQDIKVRMDEVPPA